MTCDGGGDGRSAQNCALEDPISSACVNHRPCLAEPCLALAMFKSQDDDERSTTTEHFIPMPCPSADTDTDATAAATT